MVSTFKSVFICIALIASGFLDASVVSAINSGQDGSTEDQEELQNSISELANKTLLCDLLKGTCVQEDMCHMLLVKDLVDNRPLKERPKFTCEDDRACCFSSSDADEPLNYDNLKDEEEGNGQRNGKLQNPDKISLKQAIGQVENKTMLCGILRGTCISKDMCDILHVKNMIESRSKPNIPDFSCDSNIVCCFANLTTTERVNTEKNTKSANVKVSRPSNQTPRQSERNSLSSLATGMGQLINSLVRQGLSRQTPRAQPLSIPDRPLLPRRQRRLSPIFQRPWQKNSFDYGYDDYYDYYNDYYDYPIYRRRSPLHKRPLFEPVGRVFRSRPGRTRYERPRARAGYTRPRRQSSSNQYGYGRRQSSYPKVTKKYEYHDHAHGRSLISDGLDHIIPHGFSDVFVSNLSAFCEIYDGVCVEPGECATASARTGYGRFQCNTTTICCLPDHSIKRLQAHSKGGYGGDPHTKNFLLHHIQPGGSDLFTETDREELCALKNGECIHPTLCISHHDDYDDHGHHGGGYNDHHGGGYLDHHKHNPNRDFYCNLTAICCTPSLFDVVTHVKVVDEYKRTGH